MIYGYISKLYFLSIADIRGMYEPIVSQLTGLGLGHFDIDIDMSYNWCGKISTSTQNSTPSYRPLLGVRDPLVSVSSDCV